MCEKSRPWYTVEGLSTSYQANPGKRVCDTFFFVSNTKKKKSFNEQNNKAASRGRLVGKIQLGSEGNPPTRNNFLPSK